MFDHLQTKFSGRTELPIEIQDICDALVEMGYSDDIRVMPEKMDLTQLLGTYVQWTEPSGVYGEPKWVSLIVYPENVDIMMQRLICAKELVHVCDKNVAKTKDPKEIMELAQVLCDRDMADDMQITGLKVATDVLAQGKALTLLFPKAARIVARQQINENQLTIDELEKVVQIPASTLEQMLDPEWEELADLISRI